MYITWRKLSQNLVSNTIEMHAFLTTRLTVCPCRNASENCFIIKASHSGTYIWNALNYTKLQWTSMIQFIQRVLGPFEKDTTCKLVAMLFLCIVSNSKIVRMVQRNWVIHSACGEIDGSKMSEVSCWLFCHYTRRLGWFKQFHLQNMEKTLIFDWEQHISYAKKINYS